MCSLFCLCVSSSVGDSGLPLRARQLCNGGLAGKAERARHYSYLSLPVVPASSVPALSVPILGTNAEGLKLWAVCDLEDGVRLKLHENPPISLGQVAGLAHPLVAVSVPLAALSVPLAALSVPLAALSVPSAALSVPVAALSVPLAAIRTLSSVISTLSSVISTLGSVISALSSVISTLRQRYQYP